MSGIGGVIAGAVGKQIAAGELKEVASLLGAVCLMVKELSSACRHLLL